MAVAFPTSASVLREGCGNVTLDCCTSLNHCGQALSLKCSQLLLSTQHARIAKRALATEHSILFAVKRNLAFSLPNVFSTILLARDKWQLKFLSASLMTVRCPKGFMRFGVSGNADHIVLWAELLWYPLWQQGLGKGDCRQSSTAVTL